MKPLYQLTLCLLMVLCLVMCTDNRKAGNMYDGMKPKEVHGFGGFGSIKTFIVNDSIDVVMDTPEYGAVCIGRFDQWTKAIPVLSAPMVGIVRSGRPFALYDSKGKVQLRIDGSWSDAKVSDDSAYWCLEKYRSGSCRGVRLRDDIYLFNRDGMRVLNKRELGIGKGALYPFFVDNSRLLVIRSYSEGEFSVKNPSPLLQEAVLINIEDKEIVWDQKLENLLVESELKVSLNVGKISFGGLSMNFRKEGDTYIKQDALYVMTASGMLCWSDISDSGKGHARTSIVK